MYTSFDLNNLKCGHCGKSHLKFCVLLKKGSMRLVSPFKAKQMTEIAYDTNRWSDWIQIWWPKLITSLSWSDLTLDDALLNFPRYLASDWWSSLCAFADILLIGLSSNWVGQPITCQPRPDQFWACSTEPLVWSPTPPPPYSYLIHSWRAFTDALFLLRCSALSAMGVHKLRGFINKNPQLLQDHRLHDTRLVIDGNNLYHYLYSNSRINVLYGGDYSQYADVVHHFFETLKSCNVSPHVIFDGCNENNNRRFEISRSRAVNRSQKAIALSVSGTCEDTVLPILAYDTFRAVLDELCIPHATCQKEADVEIAALANTWDCPVLSNDSDFFVFPLQQGFVLLDTLSLEKDWHYSLGTLTRLYHLKAKLFKQNNIKVYFPGMEAQRMALFATLQGNDDIHRSHFYPIYNNDGIFFRSRNMRRSE